MAGKITDIKVAADGKQKIDLAKTGEEIVRTKKPRGHKHSPVIGDQGLMVDAGDNAKILAVNIELFNMPDIDIYDPEAVQTRLTEFFQLYARNDMKPTVSGMGMALGLDRRRLWELKTGNYGTGTPNLPMECVDSIKKAYKLMENLWETYMNSGKINPVSGIFLGKNQFGYQDKMEYVVTPNTKPDSDYSEEDMRKRYMIEDGSEVEATLED